MTVLRLTVGAMFAGKSTALLRAVRSALLFGKNPLVVNHALDTRMGSDAVRSHTGDSLHCIQTSELLPLLQKCKAPTDPAAVTSRANVVDLSVVYYCNTGKSAPCTIVVSSQHGKRMWAFEGTTPVEVVDAAARVVDVSSDGLLRLLVSNIELSFQEGHDKGRQVAVPLEGGLVYDCVFVDEGQFFDDLAEFAKNCTITQGCDVHVFGLDGDYRGERFGHILSLVPWCDSVEKLVSVCGICQSRPGLLSKRLVREDGQVLVGQGEYVQSCRECFNDDL